MLNKQYIKGMPKKTLNKTKEGTCTKPKTKETNKQNNKKQKTNKKQTKLNSTKKIRMEAERII